MGLTLEDAAATGMTLAYHAAVAPDRPALVTDYGNHTFDELNANANRLVRVLRANGIGPGDSIAVVTKNRPAFVEAMAAAERAGMRFTPINFHLKGEEIGYIVDNCEAKAFIADATLGAPPVEALDYASGVQLALAAGGALDGFGDYDQTIAAEDGSDIADPELGGHMLYTSGTTGRPKGVYRRQREAPAPSSGGLAGYEPGKDMALCTGPGYHAAPLIFDIVQPLVSGAGVVMMDRWEAEETLRLIDQHKVTHCHMVATMFHRLLQLPDEVKAKYDVSSLKFVIHGAAPCPVHVKRSVIEWFGPIIWEYYAATEGGGGFFIGSEEWLTKPGTVGRPLLENLILDDDGNEVAQGEVGTIYTRAPENKFEYYKDPEKTAGSYRGDYFTLGDRGYFDEDGYLFLTGRSAELIISGGVNIYPQEIDNEIMQHPAVMDVCTIGAPNEEWGEEVRSVVQLNAGYEPSDALSEELIEWARMHLAGFKCPRGIDYSDELPRLPSGKMQRRFVREPYWQGFETT